MSAVQSVELLIPNDRAQSRLKTDEFSSPDQASFDLADEGAFDFRLLAISAAGFCVFLSVYATQALLPMLKHQFNVSALQASLTVTMTTIAVALAAPIIGLFAERIGQKTTIVGSIFCLAVPTFLAAAAHTLHMLLVWRFVQGLIMPGIIAVTMAYVTQEWSGRRVGKAMSCYICGTVLGGVTGRLLSGWIGGRFGWNYAFVALGVLDLLGGLFVLLSLPKPRRSRPVKSTAQSVHEMLAHRHNHLLLSTYFVGFNVLLVLVAAFTYITYRLAAAPFHLGPAALGLLFLVYLVGVVLTPFGGEFIDRWGHRRALLAAVLMVGVGIALTLAPSLVAVVVGLGLSCSGIFISQSSTASYMGLVAGDGRTSASGLYASFYYLGGATGAFVPGLFWKIGGWNATAIFLLAILAITAAAAWVFWAPRGVAIKTA